MTEPPRPGDGHPDPGLSALIRERGRLTNLAYRLLGSQGARQISGGSGSWLVALLF